MKLIRNTTFAILLVSASTTSTAQAAADAAAVQKNLQTYLGSEPGVVAVVPAGEDVQITLDIMPYLNKAKIPNATIKVTPFIMTAHPMGDGTWEVKSTSPLGFEMQAPDQSVQYKLPSVEWTGIFDEGLRGFTKSRGTMTNVTVDQKINDPKTGMNLNISYVVGKYAVDSTSTKREAGVVDFATSSEMSDLKGTWVPGETNSAMPAGSFSMNKVLVEGKGIGLRQRAIMDLIAWFISHPSKEAIVKDQAALKSSLLAAMPFMESLIAAESLEGLSVQTPIGQIAAQSAKIGIDMSGITKDAHLGETIAFSGLTIPQGIAPPWATDLIPNATSFGFNASGFDAETPAKMFIDKMDLSKEPPTSPDVGTALVAAALPNGTFKITLPPTNVTAPAYSIDITGGMDVSVLGPSGGNLDIKMKGLEAVAAKLQEAAQSDPQAAQAIAGIIAAKGMAKTDADGNATWAIVYTPDGKVSINGIDLGAIAPPAQ